MKILLAIDSSAASQAALQEVARRPWPAGSSIEVLTVVEPSHPFALASVVEVVAERARGLVAQSVEQLRSRGTQVEGVDLSGDPRTVILDRASTTGADLIVVGAHGMSAVERFLLGSVSQAVLRFATCSVEVVRPPAARDEPGMRVLLAVDGSESSRYAAQSVAARPWPAGTEVRVLSVVELTLTDLQAAFEIPLFDAAHLEAQRAEAMKVSQDAIASAVEILNAAGLKTSESISVLVDRPKQIILDEASQWGADLIVLGSHGHRGFSRFLLGSVSEAVATHAHCSVEIVRQTVR
jgi:nucleotide-binding universal stress UspA family protein